MGMTSTPHEHGAHPPDAVVWHDLEVGAYGADLPLWRELAGDPRAEPILDVGAGSGRVALDLARRGHRVIALDNDAELLAALRERAHGLDVEAVLADARTFELERRDLALCLVPMQTLQLLGGAPGRLAFLRRARAHLRRGGLVACAVITDIEAFDGALGDELPSVETVRVGGRRYCSQALSVRVDARSARIERERRMSVRPGAATAAAGERYVIELDRVTVPALEDDARAAGLSPAGLRSIPATAEHAGALVVMFRA